MKTNTYTWNENNFQSDEVYKMYIKVSSRSPLQNVTEKSKKFVVYSRTKGKEVNSYFDECITFSFIYFTK